MKVRAMPRWIGLALVFALASPAAADDATSKKQYRPLVSLNLENDVGALSGHQRDRFYTNGFRLAAVWPACYLPGKLRTTDAIWIPFTGRSTGESAEKRVCPPIEPRNPAQPIDYPERFNFGVVLGQNLYTPENLRIPTLQRNDRPYGAWLYLGAFVTRASDRLAQTLELDLGTVGPNAYGEEVQDFVHRHITDSPEAAGWDHQIGNEPGLLLAYDLRWRLVDVKSKSNRRVLDLVPAAGMTLGNVFTFAKVGVVGRLGWNVPSDFGPPMKIVAIAEEEGERVKDVNWSFYVFGAAEGRGVARNIFLDGNTFIDSHSVPKEDFVADLEWGLALRYKAFSFAYRQVRRSKEWVGQREPEVFGGVVLGWDFGFGGAGSGSG